MDLSELRSRRAVAFARYLLSAAEFPFATLLSIEPGEAADALVIDVEAELPQRRAVAILDHELVRLEFDVDDAGPPRAYAVRDDFPLELVHTNYSSRDGRCWLCLWEEGWAEVRARLDPEALLAWLRRWLARTAAGDNHHVGQPLEPLIQVTANTLVVPPGRIEMGVPLGLERCGDTASGVMSLRPKAAGGLLDVFVVEAPPTVHRAFSRMPRTLQDLEDLASNLGAPFLARLSKWLLDPCRELGRVLLLILQVPICAVENAEPSGEELRAFSSLATIGEIGVTLGLRFPAEGADLPRQRVVLAEGDLSAVPVVPWRVVRRLDHAAARALSGAAGPTCRAVAVGAGAVGSSVVDAAARAGWASWTVVDDDVVLPHNTVRQAQGDDFVGQGKAASLAKVVNARLAEASVTSAIAANVITPEDHAEALAAAMSAADLVMDFTASPAALRALAARGDVARVVSVFLGPDGSDMVLLAEDGARTVRLDEVEAQYFAACARNTAFAGHLDAGRLDFIRYANACQDLTRPLPPWKVLTLAGIAASRLEHLQCDKAAQLALWRLSPSGEVRRMEVEVAAVDRAECGAWRVTISRALRQALHKDRSGALPAETGGVLLGVVDLELRSVHLVDAVDAPRDSRSSPAYFVRGADGLRATVQERVVHSAGMLAYVGEWHSHPHGVPTRPSEDDEALFEHLHRIMSPTGRPYCMAIVGDAGLWLRIGSGEYVEGEAVWSAVS